MSDGFHILFVDPYSGMLCLGSDAPIGDPRRLLRKIMLVPPTEGAIPQTYTSSYDTSKEPRIAVAYNDHIFLYSVPSDAFELSRTEQQAGGLSAADLSAASAWLKWWPKDDIPSNCLQSSPTTAQSGTGPQSIWPIFVRGTSVGCLKGVGDLIINNASDRMSVWGLASDGNAAVWQIDDGILRQ
jgi:hypothetical protein